MFVMDACGEQMSVGTEYDVKTFNPIIG